MRLFVAVDVDAGVRGKLGELVPTFVRTKAAVRWVEAENYHLTIKFLGETEEGKLGEIRERLDRAAGAVPMFSLEMEGVSVFPERGPPRVIVVPAISRDQRMTKLHRLVDSALGGMGFALDTRVLVPHLTIGRVASNHGMNRLLRLMRKHEFDELGSFEVTKIVLYQSELGPGGSKYTALHTAALAAVMTPTGQP